MMKAIQVKMYGGPEVLTMVDIPKPVLEPNKIIVKIYSIGINPVETYIRAGLGLYHKQDFPFILGTDFSGVVTEISPELSQSKFKIGSRVFGFLYTKMGAYCEYISLNPEEEAVGILPENISFEQGAGIGIPYITCYHALIYKADLQPGQTVLVHGGSGGVGLAAIQLATSFGANVIATAGSDEGEKHCIYSGARKVFRHNVKGYDQEIIEYAQELGGVDIIFENAMHFNANIDIELINRGGHILIVGARADASCNLPQVLFKEIKIEGIIIFSMSPKNFKFIIEDIENKLSSKVYTPIVFSYPFSNVSNAHEEIIRPKLGASQGKIVLNTQFNS